MGCGVMVKRAKQISDSLELGMLLALVGGFMDVYSYMGRGGVFANAQTGNILLFGVHLSEGAWGLSLKYLFPVLSFAFGIMLADLIHARMASVLHWRQGSILIEASILLGVSFIGPNLNLLANCLTSFACGVQVESFRKVHGRGIATTMCIGNLRSALQNVDDYIINHEPGFLANAALYAIVIATFVLGAVLGNWSLERFGLASIRIATLLLVICFLIMFIDREHREEIRR